MKQIIKISLTSLFFLIIYFYLFYSGLIKYLALGSSYYFGDYKIFVNALNCIDKGLSPYVGPKEYNCYGFNYGHLILILTPFKNFFINSNPYFIPIIFLFLFIVVTIIILNTKNLLQFFLASLTILNPATLLLIERMNLDILLYFIIIILAFNKISFLNWLLIIYSFLFKFHPFVYGIIIFVEKKKRNLINLLLIFIFMLFFSLFLIFLYREEYTLIFSNTGGWKMGLHYLFSIKTIPKILKESFSIHYGLSILIINVFFIWFVFKKSIKLEGSLQDDYLFKKKLFLLSSNSLLFCFLTFSNALYREVFLILTIPYIFLHANSNIFKNILYILYLKFIFNFIYTLDLNFETFYHVNGVRYYMNHFLIISFFKGAIDFILMLFLGVITLKMNLDIWNSLKKRNI